VGTLRRQIRFVGGVDNAVIVENPQRTVGVGVV